MKDQSNLGVSLMTSQIMWTFYKSRQPISIHFIWISLSYELQVAGSLLHFICISLSYELQAAGSLLHFIWISLSCELQAAGSLLQNSWQVYRRYFHHGQHQASGKQKEAVCWSHSKTPQKSRQLVAFEEEEEDMWTHTSAKKILCWSIKGRVANFLYFPEPIVELLNKR